MILTGVIAIVMVLSMIGGGIHLLFEQSATITDMREANKRLYADNQQLMNALAAKHGQILGLEPEVKVNVLQAGALGHGIGGERVPLPPPYFKSKDSTPVEMPATKVKTG